MTEERTLDFLEAKIEELRQLNASGGIDLSKEIERLEEKLSALRQDLYSNLTDWERVRIARHPKRPYALDYIASVFSDFYELRGDRIIGDDRALLTGLARLEGRPVALLVQQKGRTTEENKERFFGMTRPQGYRKARRTMELAERFGFPVISLIDTSGAYPGVESEELNIGGAIAENLQTMAGLRVPTVAVVIGEGGSGGALAIGLADRVLMLENAIYSVITPEGAAAILWKDKEKAREAATALQMTAPTLLERGLIDGVVAEPLGGAHKNPATTSAALKEALVRHLHELEAMPLDRLLAARYARYRGVGRYVTRAPDQP
ncbi:MAG: acetyl-CoA carboxylase carboxyltransferase subunit alpha [Candidatus Bipolaricaulis sp.]|nr:acetyl-CoA carboxylase carboxyltransferase subunit alpha [Candidatus Bipolaricaulis sp.]MDD5219757.1 acetyl-CoA carboxylase carboxyltransferase subunit alpha [Candidatus Bipolaricaulis sp.]MDD5645820.1 acetyl-CoA carboxylase carboxyltransferase subunit alpha [Candidatus Bipolaricaulis sp.]